MSMEEGTVSASPSTDRALDILEALSASLGGLTLSELVRVTELPQNSVFRITQALHARGYLHRSEEDRRFSLSHRLLDLARPTVEGKSLVVCAIDGMRELSERTGETVQLMVRSGRKGVVLEQVSGKHPVKVMGEVGLQVPLYSCAPGKAILAWLPDSAYEEWLGAVKLKRFTPTTLATKAALKADLIETRARGYAVDRSEGLEGIRCVAAPILDAYDEPVGAVTMMAPVFRLAEEEFPRLGALSEEAARMIERRLRQ
ncbi:MAG: IclR family transcriptional regulator [Verrucomicrobiota bacterium]